MNHFCAFLFKQRIIFHYSDALQETFQANVIDNDCARSEVCKADIDDDNIRENDYTPYEYEDSSSESCNSDTEVCGALKRTNMFQDLSLDNHER